LKKAPDNAKIIKYKFLKHHAENGVSCLAVREWIVQRPDEGEVRALEAAGYSRLLARLLANRGLHNPADAQAFLCGGQELYDPWGLKGMEAAVSRIKTAIDKKEKIVIYGDYDVDGVTATALLLTYLNSRGAIADYYIPERESEGYGLNAGAVQAICKAGAKLIVTVDTGISALTEAVLAKELGVDIIITDHHEPRAELPVATAIINPKQAGCPYPFKQLAGVGVAFKLVCALERDEAVVFEKFGALLTLGTVADVVPLIGENRAIVKRGLELMQRSQSCGLKSLLEAAGVRGARLNTGLLSFTAAPRINAAGRMGSAGDALKLLTAGDEATAAALAIKLDESNRQRQEIESRILIEAIERINLDGVHDPVLMVRGEGWHNGVIGIVASRLAELYAKPAVVVSFEGDTGRASCRSFRGFDIHDALMKNVSLLERFGGHELAAGFTVKAENYAALYEALQQYARGLPSMPVPSLSLEFELEAGEITLTGARECKKLEPCGEGNPQPLFYIRAARVISLVPLKEGRHLRLELKCGVSVFKAMLFNADKADFDIVAGDIVDLAAALDLNPYKGNEYLSVIVRDMRASQIFDEGRELYRLLLTEPAATDSRALPRRGDFAAVYRFLCSCENGRAELKTAFAQIQDTTDSFNFTKLLLILDIFSEMKLVEFSRTDDEITFEINKNIKIDLEQSRLLRKLSGAL